MNDEQKQEMYRHSMSHVMAKAIKQLYPGVKLAIGPAIDNGFYYDFDNLNITQADFDKIEAKMRDIIANNEDFVRKEVSKTEALEMFIDEPYKTELINELPLGEKITVYYTGEDFYDLCRGPHVENTKFLRGFSFKINRVNGAYWRGSEKNKMLTRIYVYGFLNKDDLKECIRLEEEAKQRDHRKIGKEMGIFMFNDLVGKGLPMWLPKGYILRRELSDYIIDKELALGYQHVMTPSLGNINLYKTSGHWEHYKEDMFPAMEVDDEGYVLRPMNCPHHMVIYKNFMHSYRDLPLRLAEIANDFRFEASGSLCGIERTRAFTQNDSHIFCRPDQIKDEIEGVIKLILDVYKDFGFKNYKLRLSLRDKQNTDKYFGNDELWEKSEAALREILKNSGADYYEAVGEAAFYGPKIDVQVKSAIGHDITLSTVQLDYQLPERFELEYIDENNDRQRPVVIHRAILGSLDRFIAFILEETKGLLPAWLSPVQVQIITVNENVIPYAQDVENKLKSLKVRVETDFSNESVGKKIRSAVLSKSPFILVLGDKEKADGTVAVRKRGSKDTETMPYKQFEEMLIDSIANKALN
ncbi:MAG TPA: threonine--tRNA ligase [Candidatus Onthoplasma faecigallinarum]|nr:threonine--tRNA ligase [Candidatus Onthoplasma faecigallinarum]